MTKIRNGGYTIELSPNGKQYILKKGVFEVATIATSLRMRGFYKPPRSVPFMTELLRRFLVWYLEV